MNEKINPIELLKKTEEAKSKITTGEQELAGVKDVVQENLDVLSHEASMDYMSKLNADLKNAVDSGDQAKEQEIKKRISDHEESMKEYAAKARENVASYIDSKGEVNVEEFEKKMNSFVYEYFALWYGKDCADKANIKMFSTPLAERDYESMLKNDASKFGEYSTNPDRTGTDYIEKKEIPKTKFLDMEEFIGKPKSEVMKAVVEKYGADYRIPDMEDEQYILSLPVEKIPKEIESGHFFSFQDQFLTIRTAMPVFLV